MKKHKIKFSKTEQPCTIHSVVRSSVLELRNPEHTFFKWVNDELAHIRQGEDDYIENWFDQYKDYGEEHEEDMLNSLWDWIPFCLSQKMYEYGFDMNKYGYFNFA